MATVLGNAIGFLQEFGLFDVILPFLLVFAVVFGILEKTRILGEEKIGKEMYARKNLDAIVAFVIGLLVVAATKIVGVINEALPAVALLVVVVLSFMLMIGLFVNPDKTIYEHFGKGFMTFTLIFMFIIVLGIFLGTIPANEEQSWLGFVVGYIGSFWDGTIVGTIVLFLLVIGAIVWITRGNTGKGEKD